MNCAYCKHNGGAVYTSLPPKYKCSITGELHLALDDCDVDFEPIKHGRWIKAGEDLWDCSECGQRIFSMSKQDREEFHKWCGRCGAKMDEATP